MTKKERQGKIKTIIEAEVMGTQDLLAEKLEQAGIEVTQATISRDIREMGLVKMQGPDGQIRYGLPQVENSKAYTDRLAALFRHSVLEAKAAQNLVVIKTLPGAASAACSAIDHRQHDGIVGTLAGDDTAFVALEDSEAAARLCDTILQLIV